MLLKLIRRLLAPSAPHPAAPFTSIQAFTAAFHGHSGAHNCFAWAQYHLDAKESSADCIIHAIALPADRTQPPLFSLVCTLYAGAEWPLSRPLQERFNSEVDALNVLCKPSETDDISNPE